jgi:hypothetical protein
MFFMGETSSSSSEMQHPFGEALFEALQQEGPQQPEAPQQPTETRKRCSCQNQKCGACLPKPPTAPADPPASKKRKRVYTCWRDREDPLNLNRTRCSDCENFAKRKRAADQRQLLAASQPAIDVASGLKEPIAALQHARRQLAAIGSPAAAPQPAVLVQHAAQPVAAKPAALTTAAPADTAIGTGGSPSGSPGGSPDAAPQPAVLVQPAAQPVAAKPAALTTAAASAAASSSPAVAAAVESEPVTMLPPSAVEVVAESSELASAMADTLKCSICLDLYDDPLILSGCGHTFCRECITKHLQGRKGLQQPVPKMQEASAEARLPSSARHGRCGAGGQERNVNALRPRWSRANSQSVGVRAT